MYSIKLKVRELKLLRDNLTGNPEGYDYTDLQVLDHLAKKATVLLGDYATDLAALGRKEKEIRRRLLRAPSLALKEAINGELLDIEDQLEAMNAEADEAELVEFLMEDGHHALVKQKLQAQKGWLGGDDIRSLIIGMMEAVMGAKQVPDPVLAKAKEKEKQEAKEEAPEPVTT